MKPSYRGANMSMRLIKISDGMRPSGVQTHNIEGSMHKAHACHFKSV